MIVRLISMKPQEDPCQVFRSLTNLSFEFSLEEYTLNIILEMAMNITYIWMCFILHFNVSVNTNMLKCVARLSWNELQNNILSSGCTYLMNPAAFCTCLTDLV